MGREGRGEGERVAGEADGGVREVEGKIGVGWLIEEGRSREVEEEVGKARWCVMLQKHRGIE